MDTEYFNEYLQSPALQAKYGSVGAYVNFMKSQEPEINQSDNTQDGNKFNLMDYLPFGSKSISGSIMRGIGQYMPDMDPRQKNLNQFYDVNNGTIQSGLMKDYNPVSGGFLNTITGGKFGDPTKYGLQDAYQKRIDTINKTLQRKYTNKGLSFDNTELDERRDQLIADMNNESNAMSGGGDGIFGLGTQGQKSYSNPGDTFGINAITGGPVSNKTGKGRTDYMGGGRAGYFFGGRIGFAGGGMDMGNEENQAQSAAIGTGTPGPGDTGGEGGDNPSDDSDTQFSGGDNPPTNIGNPFDYEDNAPPTNVRNPFGYQDNIMKTVLNNRYKTNLEEDIDDPIVNRIIENNKPDKSPFAKFVDHDNFTDRLKESKIPNYHQLGGFDFMARFPGTNPNLAKGLASAYQNIFEYGRAVADGFGGVTFEDAGKKAAEESRLNAVGIDAFSDPNSKTYKTYSDGLIPEIMGNVRMAKGGLASIL